MPKMSRDASFVLTQVLCPAADRRNMQRGACALKALARQSEWWPDSSLQDLRRAMVAKGDREGPKDDPLSSSFQRSGYAAPWRESVFGAGGTCGRESSATRTTVTPFRLSDVVSAEWVRDLDLNVRGQSKTRCRCLADLQSAAQRKAAQEA